MTTYTLTADEAALYDGDDQEARELVADLVARFGPVNPDGDTEVFHPEGFVVNTFGNA